MKIFQEAAKVAESEGEAQAAAGSLRLSPSEGSAAKARVTNREWRFSCFV